MDGGAVEGIGDGLGGVVEGAEDGGWDGEDGLAGLGRVSFDGTGGW